MRGKKFAHLPQLGILRINLMGCCLVANRFLLMCQL